MRQSLVHYFVTQNTISKVSADTADNLPRFSKVSGHTLVVTDPDLNTRKVAHLQVVGNPTETAHSAWKRLVAKLSGTKSVGTPPDRSGNANHAHNAALEKLRRINSQPVPKWTGASNTIFPHGV